MNYTQYRIATRDPLRNFQFTITLDDLGLVGGVQRVSGLSATVSAAETWEGGNNRHRYANPDKITWEPVTLEQGIALDDTLEIWARSVHDFVSTGKVQPGGIAVKRNVTIEVWSPKTLALWGPSQTTPPGVNPARRYHLYNAWISRYNALPRLDALTAEVAITSLEIIHEGFKVELFTPPDPSSPSPAPPAPSAPPTFFV